MTPIKLDDETRPIGKPVDWDEDIHGECLTLSVHDTNEETGNRMISGWKPSEGELEVLNQGGHVWLSIMGRVHPVVQLFAG